ncbi:uncharacterized protein [Acropora muricata]|uniref:uncharacterized protein n=1 Tax=Acropora muricata TaxID=159855 RepID=UPI0034E6164F
MAETTHVDEILAESVRKLPILYDKSSKDFKDKHKKERAWDDVAKEVGFPTGKEAETGVRNLRNRYTRDKNKIKKAKVSGTGTGTDSVTDAKRETSELFPFLEWLEPYIQLRNSTSNLILINDESDGTGESEKKEMFKSQVPGRTKYMKRSKAKDDIDTAELEFLQTIGDRLKEKATEPKKDEERIFGDLIASQLRQLQYHERVMAKMEINIVLYAHLLKKNSPNQAYSAGGFLAQDQRCDDMPHKCQGSNTTSYSIFCTNRNAKCR